MQVVQSKSNSKQKCPIDNMAWAPPEVWLGLPWAHQPSCIQCSPSWANYCNNQVNQINQTNNEKTGLTKIRTFVSENVFLLCKQNKFPSLLSPSRSFVKRLRLDQVFNNREISQHFQFKFLDEGKITLKDHKSLNTPSSEHWTGRIIKQNSKSKSNGQGKGNIK